MVFLKNRFTIHHIKSEDFRLDGGSMFGIVPRILWEKSNPPDDQNRIRMTTNCILASDGKTNILIETGMGSKEDDKFRDIYRISGESIDQALQSRGIPPEDVHHVILSHLHFDHCGGAVKQDRSGNFVPSFPNASYYVQAKELEAALHPNEKTRRSYLKYNVEPLLKAGQLKTVEGTFELQPGISLIPVEGHSEGMHCVKIDMGERTLFYSADLFPLKEHVHVPVIMSYDLYPLKTLQTKKILIPEAVKGKWIMVFTHDLETPFGLLEEREGKISIQSVKMEEERVSD
jgi:glyoxylase-like metal-dependent hydrolase (beta-lactamase superfamily II)